MVKLLELAKEWRPGGPRADLGVSWLAQASIPKQFQASCKHFLARLARNWPKFTFKCEVNPLEIPLSPRIVVTYGL